MPNLERTKREGKRLGPGIYEWRREIHVDIIEVVVACGGNPLSPADVETAQRVVAETMREQFPEVAIEVNDVSRMN